MEPESTAHAFFTTPELASTLFSSLTPNDLTRCIRVCKQWMNHAGPVLWRNFCYKGLGDTRLPPNTTAGLIRNLPHIRTVELTLHDHAILQELAHGVPRKARRGKKAAVNPCPPCTDLKRLTLENSTTYDEGIGRILPNIVTLLNHNLRLTHLTMPFLEVKIGDPVLAAISNLKHLQSLTVYSGGSSWRVGTRTISLLLQTCLPLPKLTELCIDLKVSWQGRPKRIGNLEDDEDDDFEFTDDEDVSDDEDKDVSENTGVPSLETIIKEAAIARFSQTPTPGKIKSLRLPVAAERNNNQLALPLLKSGLLDLESCTIFSFAKDSKPNDIEQAVREYCPNLKHLRCAKYDSFGDGQRACAFIRGCSGIQSFAAEGYREEICSYDRRIPNKSLDIISTLVSHHCDTLEDFELDRCTGTFMSDLREVLTRCKLLKRYYVTGYYLEARGTYRPGVARSDLMDPSGADWACTELRELRLTLDRTVGNLANRFYAQIGRLEKLEQLILDATHDPYSIERMWDCSYDLVLSRGYLDKMVGSLKSLRVFKVDIAFYRNMRRDELAFIQAHCPLLKSISVLGRAG